MVAPVYEYEAAPESEVGQWTTSPEGIAVFVPNPFLGDEDRPSSARTIAELLDEDEDVEPGVCWCGAYGRLGAVHNAKPSADEPVEECGRFL